MARSLLLALVVSLLSWSGSASAKIELFACEPEWRALAEEIGGSRVRAVSATTAFQDPHRIEARPSLIARARRADLLFCNGAELEIGWLPLLLRQSGNRRIQEGQPGYLLAADQVERLEVPASIDRSRGDVHASGNPHVHLDPYRLLQVAGALAQRLSLVDPDGGDYYAGRLVDFERRWLAAVGGWEAQAAALNGSKAIVYHRNWTYLLTWLGVEVVGDLEPKPGIPPSSAHLAALLQTSREQRPDFILVAAHQDDKGARWLADKSGVPVVYLPFTIGGNEQASDYFGLYDSTLSLLLGAR